jgi:hypothetical protein
LNIKLRISSTHARTHKTYLPPSISWTVVHICCDFFTTFWGNFLQFLCNLFFNAASPMLTIK